MADLTTLVNVKAYLDFADPTAPHPKDPELQRLITFATSMLVGLVNLPPREDSEPVQFQEDDYTERYDGPNALWPGGRILNLRHAAPNLPVTAVRSVTVNGVPIPRAVGSPPVGFTFTRFGIELAGGYRFTPGVGHIQVRYTAGYPTGDPVLAELEQACVEIVTFIFRNKGFLGVASKTLGNETVHYAANVISQALPARTQLLVDRLRPRVAAA